MNREIRAQFECGDKTQYSSARAARTAVRLLKSKNIKVHAYPCTTCSYWHVGRYAENDRKFQLAARQVREKRTYSAEDDIWLFNPEEP